jgi:hypothetical protein
MLFGPLLVLDRSLLRLPTRHMRLRIFAHIDPKCRRAERLKIGSYFHRNDEAIGWREQRLHHSTVAVAG